MAIKLESWGNHPATDPWIRDQISGQRGQEKHYLRSLRALTETHQDEDAGQVDDDPEARQDQDAVAGDLADGAHLGVVLHFHSYSSK